MRVAPALAIEQFVLHGPPDMIPSSQSNTSPTEPNEGMSPALRDLVGGGPAGQLDAVVGVHDATLTCLPLANRHVEGVDDQLRVTTAQPKLAQRQGDDAGRDGFMFA